MNAVPFDTLRMAQRLQAAGFSGPQAAGASEALAEALVGAGLATKGDLVTLRTELKADIAGLQADLDGKIAGLQGAIELLRRDMTIKLGGMIILAVGVLLAAMRYLPPHS
jgi:hypothetical protein